ncbi:MAG: hypothetical protein ACRD0O_05610 [Acidimicrobiia bacterium]
MYRRTIITLVVLAILGVVPLGTAPAGAAERTAENPHPDDTHCLAEFDIVLSPGLSSVPSSGTLTTNGETGTITCEGPIKGYQAVGLGRRGEVGRYGTDGPDTCASGGEAEVSFSFTIPTAGGDQHVVGTLTVDYGPLEGGNFYGGTLTGPQMYGKFEVVPLEGNCVTTPVTRVHVRGDEWIVNET